LGKEIMLDRLIKLEDNFSYLEKFKKSVFIDNILEDKFDEWALRYNRYDINSSFNKILHILI